MDKGGHLFLGGALGIILIVLTHYFFHWFTIDLESIAIIGLIIYLGTRKSYKKIHVNSHVHYHRKNPYHEQVY